jgi:hypothetical protein
MADENTPAPRLRRLTLPPAGGTGGRLEARVSVLERTEQHTSDQIDEIKRSQGKMAVTVDTMDTTLTTLVGKVDELLAKRKFWVKVTGSVLVSVLVALFGFLMKISFMVQSAKLP